MCINIQRDALRDLILFCFVKIYSRLFARSFVHLLAYFVVQATTKSEMFL